MPPWWHRTLRESDTPQAGVDVSKVQRIVGARESGVYDELTVARVRGWQRVNGLEPTGVVDKATARKMGA